MDVAGLGESHPRVTFWNAQAETLPRERLEALALERMRATLARLGGHAGWRRRLGGVSPHDVKTLDDWRRLPFLTKDDLRDPYPFGLACGSGYRRIQMSSGTTGNPILNPYTPITSRSSTPRPATLSTTGARASWWSRP